jgi:hypothetical protein
MEIENIDNMPEEDVQVEGASEPQAAEAIPVIEPTIEPDMSYQQVTSQDTCAEEPPIATACPRPANATSANPRISRERQSTLESWDDMNATVESELPHDADADPAHPQQPDFFAEIARNVKAAQAAASAAAEQGGAKVSSGLADYGIDTDKMTRRLSEDIQAVADKGAELFSKGTSALGSAISSLSGKISPKADEQAVAPLVCSRCGREFSKEEEHGYAEHMMVAGENSSDVRARLCKACSDEFRAIYDKFVSNE